MLVDLPLTVIVSFLNAFTYNLIIAFFAMAIGCPIGFLLGVLARFPSKFLRWSLNIVHSLFCNVPSFVLLFYFALIVPSQFELLGESWSVLPLFKAILALSVPVIGYYIDVFRHVFKDNMRFSIASFKPFFIVILMASTTASVIGVEEIMATANTYIASEGNTSKVLSVYLLVVLIFILSGFLIQALFCLSNHLYHRLFGEQYSLDKGP